MKIKNEKALVVAPHADDETFGCGGTIAKLTGDGVQVDLLLGTLGNGMYNSYENRKRELNKALEILGVNNLWIIRGGEEGRMDSVPQVVWVSHIEETIKQEQPQIVFIPYPSHHQDHIVLHQACMAAMRPGVFQPEMILMYEYTYPTWEVPDQYNGRMFVDITETLPKKCLAINSYESQLRGDNTPVSSRAVRIMATTRGLSIGVQFAEMFYVIQMKGLL